MMSVNLPPAELPQSGGKVPGESRTERRRECHLAPAQAVQPGHAQTLGLGFQMVGQAHRQVEPAAESGDCLQPRLG